MGERHSWAFPVRGVHAGILLGNGRLGVMVWGSGNVLRLTLGRADLWDHRGGKRWTEQMTYGGIRALLAAGDEAGLRRIFEGIATPAGQPANPSVVPVGRFEVVLGEGVELVAGSLDLETGELVVSARHKGAKRKIKLELGMEADVLHVELPRGMRAGVRAVPAWEGVGEYLKTISFEAPRMIGGRGETVVGWVQTMPADPPAGALCRQEDEALWITVQCCSAAHEEAEQAARQVLEQAVGAGVEDLRRRNSTWWRRYWSAVPEIDIPNERLRFIYRYGMYKFAGLTHPGGVAATLQGPWIEDYQMPPWSSDYHFNINVQMCYWPAYQGNRLEHLRPLFEMVWGWRETLRENARRFVGIDDGLMLPHSVDDRCVTIGGFWSGTVDPACTAWVAKMMYDLWLYGGDDGENTFLRERAWPFMRGAMRVYEAMLEKEGEQYVLPVSVSPEYRGSAMNAWGRNASFQIGCIHWLVEALEHTAQVLGEVSDPQWAAIQKGLPRACVEGAAGREMIMLWEGTPLEESHRHHSHWAGLYPWDVIDLEDPAWKRIVGRTYDWWNRQGMGQWSGWCVPWAAMLHARVGSPELAEALLEYWERIYTNEGHGTLHDANVFKRNVQTMAKRPPEVPYTGGGARGEVMQIEAGMAAAAAVLDGLVQVRRGVHYLFAGAPGWWRRASFKGIRTEGGFLVSGQLRDGQVPEVQVRATRAGVFRMRWTGGETVRCGDKEVAVVDGVVSVEMGQGEVVRLSSSKGAS